MDIYFPLANQSNGRQLDLCANGTFEMITNKAGLSKPIF